MMAKRKRNNKNKNEKSDMKEACKQGSRSVSVRHYRPGEGKSHRQHLVRKCLSQDMSINKIHYSEE